MSAKDYSLLEARAQEIRESIISMITRAGSGHPAGALGMTEVFTSLYFSILKHDPSRPNWEDRDRLILSNGHICPVLYASLAHAEYFSLSELETLREFGSMLQGHPHLGSAPGVENTSGPLGQGLSQACGIAHVFKREKKHQHIYCITSDGEHQEGQTWEAYLYAAENQLSNLTVFIDRNNIQIDGFTEDIIGLEPLKQKLEAFNWHTQVINGHSFAEIHEAVTHAHASHKPSAIICQTTPGKGVSFMENKPEWHGKAPSKEEAERALKELTANQARKEDQHE